MSKPGFIDQLFGRWWPWHQNKVDHVGERPTVPSGPMDYRDNPEQIEASRQAQERAQQITNKQESH
jgi:hypothetical protein